NTAHSCPYPPRRRACRRFHRRFGLATALGPPITPLPTASHFVRHVTNHYVPWRPGTRWVFRGFGSEGHERTVVTVLKRTRDIQGITATVVPDVVRATSGRLAERTFDRAGPHEQAVTS
ncbi:MAG: hypothetical protein ACR2LE_04885, partial [Nocardioidaceae bacterium]